MQSNHIRYSRKSLRLKHYDYSSSGAYFITLCINHRALLLGEIKDGKINPNHAGAMVTYWFNKLEQKFTDIKCDIFVCMPNHIHFILHKTANTNVPVSNLGTVIQWFKTMTTNDYIRGVKNHHWPSFKGKLWQRNYWERIIRNEQELQKIREYILNNPTQWELDKYSS